MTVYVNLDTDEAFERFKAKYDEALEKEDESFNLVALINKFNEEENKDGN